MVKNVREEGGEGEEGGERKEKERRREKGGPHGAPWRSRGKGASLFLYDSSGTLERGTQWHFQ